MIRTIIAAFAAILLVACGGTPDTTDLDATFETYLPWGAERSDVETGMGGLEYIVLKEGPDGGASPVPSDMVRVHYEGRTAGGDKFDSSYDRGSPSMFRLNQVIPGWTQGLQQMTEGDVYLFYIPNALAYGNRNRGDIIKAGDDLVFQVELGMPDAGARTHYLHVASHGAALVTQRILVRDRAGVGPAIRRAGARRCRWREPGKWRNGRCLL